MSDRFAALAGFAPGADETGASATATATDASGFRTGALAGLDTDDSISLGGAAAGNGAGPSRDAGAGTDPPPKRPEMSPLRRSSTHLGAAAPTVSDKNKGNRGTSDEAEATPRQDKPTQARRRYGVRITDDEAAGRSGGGKGAIDLEDSMDDNSESELQRVRRDLSQSHEETTFDDDGLSDSAANTGTAASKAAVAAATMGRRSAAGISLKDAEAKMRRLEAENNELKIEIDIYRQNMSPTESQNRVVSLMKERQVLKRKEAQFGQVLREQDKVIRENKKKLKRWGDRDPIREAEERAELERQLEEMEGQLQEERKAKDRAYDEVEFLKQRRREGTGDLSSISERDDGEASRLRRMLDDQRDDHEEAIYALGRERDELQARVEELESGTSRNGGDRSVDGAGSRTLRRELQDAEQDLVRAQSENDEVVKRLEEMQQRQSELEQDLERARDDLQASQSSEDALQRELDVAKRRLEHVHSEQRDDVEQQIRDAEDAVAERLGAQNDRLRDELAAARLETQQRAETVEQLEGQREEDDTRMADVEYELQQALATLEEREEQVDTLNRDLDAFEYEVQKLRQEGEEQEQLIDEYKADLKARETDLGETNRELQEHADRVRELEESLEDMKADFANLEAEFNQLQLEFDESQERSVRREAALLERLTAAESDKADLQSQMEAIQHDFQNASEEARELGRDVDLLKQERRDLKAEAEKLYEKLEDAIEDLKEEEKRREGAEDDLEKRLDEEEQKWRSLVEEKEREMDSLDAQLKSVEDALEAKKSDVEELQDALRNKENESQRLGQSHSNDRYSLELEIDRLKRDLSRCESDLDRARKDVERREEAIRDREEQLRVLNAEHRNVVSQLASESQGRLGLSERWETQQASLREAQEQLRQQRAKVEELEDQLNKEERSLMHVEQANNSRLMERNMLLLTVYQMMGKILGTGAQAASGGTPRKSLGGGTTSSALAKSDATELKPFTNFAVFHDSLLGRVQRINEVQLQFDKRAKSIEESFAERMQALKRQQDARFRQIDRFEVAIKNATDKQAQWRTRVHAKQTELESVKATNGELQQQLASLKTRANLASTSPGEASRLSAMTTRANNAERRLVAAQNQAQQAEERLGEAKSKYGEGEGKWAARIKELEARCKAAEERVKRERQGAKERVAELVDQLRRLEKEYSDARKRKEVLDNVVNQKDS